jgi:hypothetical protein
VRGLLGLLVLLVAAAAPAQDGPHLRSRFRRGVLRIDGALDEADWAEAHRGTGFIERVPTPRAVPSARTEVRVLHDRDALYVGITSYLDEDEPAPRALELTRDSSRIWDDDAITLKFDVRRDRRSTVGFVLNPAGAQLDFLSLDNGRVFRREYDAVWEGAARTFEDRWEAEFRIPAAALGLPPGSEGRIVGFNVTRDHNARQATYDWSHLPPEFGAFSALHYGALEGTEEIGGGQPLVLNPYVLVRGPAREAWDFPFELQAGGEVRMRMAQDIWGEVSLVTDFAEVDLDSQVVNLDRFPLFFPERRPFFLTGLDVFDFGAEGEAQLFFTRRIGLDANARPVPIIAGLKVYGRQGRFSFGLLDVATAGTRDQPAANWGVARLRVNVGEASYVGLLVGTRTFLPGDLLSPQPGYLAEPHTSLGVDALVRALDGRFELRTFGALTHRDGDAAAGEDDASADGLAGGATVRWRGEEWMPIVSALYLQDGFRPELGFLRRPAIFRLSGSLPWVGRSLLPSLRQVRLGVDGRVELDERLEALLRLSYGWNATVQLMNQLAFSASAAFVEDVLRDDFILVGQIPIAAGTYRGVATTVGLSTSSARNPSFSVEVGASNAFFGGTSYTVEAELAASFGPHARLSVAGAGSLLDFRGRDPTPTLAANGVLSFTPTAMIVLDLVGQLNTVVEEVIAQARLRWRYLPGSDLFVVYRERVGYGADRRNERRVTLKVSYRYDALL